MTKIYNDILELIGHTPLLKLNNIEKVENLSAKIFAKLESFNPAGSVKDRAAKSMLEEAEKSGILVSDSVIIEPTSGNTGIGLALCCAIKGYKLIIVMPENMSRERQSIMRAYGAEIVLTKAEKGMSGAIEKAEELVKNIKNSFIPNQFGNKANAKAHLLTTGPEIWEDTDGKVDIFVAGIGTGGTISGVGEFLKSKNPDIKIIGAEPLSSPFLSLGKSGKHAIQGLGAGFKPDILNCDIYDEIIAVSDENAIIYGKMLIKNEGVLAGISSGAALSAAVTIAKRRENKDKNIVVLLPDSGDRYFSTKLFEN